MPTLKEIEDDEKVLQENSKMVATMNEENIKGKDCEWCYNGGSNFHRFIETKTS